MKDLTDGQKVVLWLALAGYVKAIGLGYKEFAALLEHIEINPPPTTPLEAWQALDFATIDAGIETS